MDELEDTRRHEEVERAIGKLSGDGHEVDGKTIYSLMERFI